MNRHDRRVWIGLFFLLAAIFGGAWCLWQQPQGELVGSLRQLRNHLLTVPTRYAFDDSASAFPLETNDPIFARVDGEWVLVGTIEWAPGSDNETVSRKVSARWFETRYHPVDATWHYYETPKDFGWIANVLLPENKRLALAKSLVERFRSHQAEIITHLEPVVTQSISGLAPLVQSRIRESLESQQAELAALAEKYHAELIQERIVPIVKTEVMPIIRSRSQPLLNQIGEELFERVSLWSFAWRYLYDTSPLPQRDLVKRKFERFVEQEAVPVLESHTEEVLELVRAIARDIASNEVVRKVAKDATSEMFHDPELRRILAKCIEDVFTDSEPFRETLKRNLESESGQQLARSLQRTLEPWLREAGVQLLGTPEEGLTPELVAVLRSQILAKDQRWIVVAVEPKTHPSSPPNFNIQLTRGNEWVRYPMLIEAQRRNTLTKMEP